MDVTKANDDHLSDQKLILEDNPFVDMEVESPDGMIKITKVETLAKYNLYLVNDQYIMGFYKAAELLGGEL